MDIILSPQLRSAVGLFVFALIAWTLSERKTYLPVGQLLIAVALQLAIAALFIRVPVLRDGLEGMNAVVDALQGATREATSFLFGYAGRPDDMPFEVTNPDGLFIFAIQALPLLVFVSALAAVLWYLGILKAIIRLFALLLSRLLGTGGAISLAASANVLLGQTEAPLLIRPYLGKISRSELFAIIACGYATVAGSVMALYGFILRDLSPTMLGHVIVASFISVPAALAISAIMVPPEKGAAPTSADAVDGFKYDGVMDAFTEGATEGGKLWANIIVSILAFLAVVALFNIMLAAWVPPIGGEAVTVQRAVGVIFIPLVWLAGLPWDQALTGAELMGLKTATNEVVAYQTLAGLPEGTLDPRSTLIMVYAMCGFANIGSLGIAIGGLSVLEPSRRPEVLNLAPRALIAGTLATLSSGAAVGVVM